MPSFFRRCNLFLTTLTWLVSVTYVESFSLQPKTKPCKPQSRPVPLFSRLYSSNTDDSTNESPSPTNKSIGDPIREATGIRPSLHPVTINAIADALKIRAKNLPDQPLQSPPAEPLQVAATAGGIAVQAIQKRQSSSQADGMEFTKEEEQTVAGRVVGVVMRFQQLEALLLEKCRAVSWIAKYHEWNSFGIVLGDDADDETDLQKVNEQILLDPLLTMNRAECLLALFLATVEAPSLEKSQQQVPGGSQVDFLDDDRKEVLMGTFQ